MDAGRANKSSMRVLTRPSSSTPSITSSSSSSSSSSSPNPLPRPTGLPNYPSHPPSPSSSSALSTYQQRISQGIVVVGFIGRRPEDLTHLINRVVDANVFGSGQLDTDFYDFGNEERADEVRDWLKCRKLSYYFEEEKGFLFLQFSSSRCPAMYQCSELDSGFDSLLEEFEFADLQGMLFMFSVCHIIIFVHEGSRFDTQTLKSVRILQASKNAMAPFVRSRTASLTSRPYSSSSSRSNLTTTSSKNPSPNRRGGMISLISSLGSYPSLFPGQCSPVTLFVFLDDYSDITNPVSNLEEKNDALARTSLPMKTSGSVVMLSRPVSKSEGGLRKKLQSSLETQIRFLIKKCRALTSSESGSRSGSVSNAAPLFSLDASRAVVLLDKSSNKRGESLDFATSLLNDVLNGQANSDSLLLESQTHSGYKEDVISIKEFINKQSDILRGRGGLVTNANGGSAVGGGAGMVAVAAAAAAASASTSSVAASHKKASAAPELPSKEIWLSSSKTILHGILSSKQVSLDETGISKRKPHIAPKGSDPLQTAVSWLQVGRGVNGKFSTLWCQKSLPIAKEIYLKELPDFYPTSLHKTHVEKALNAFYSMVKGPSVSLYAKKLEDELNSIWLSGRQQCDAISFSGKPCMSQRHDNPEDLKAHSSGFVFLHACACGRSRKLRPDPFDFESANITFNNFPDCDDILPSLLLPKLTNKGLIQPCSWSLIRIGCSKDYEPSKGLMQSGFSASHKFLSKWKILLAGQTNPNGLLSCNLEEGFASNMSTADAKAENQRIRSENTKSEIRNITFGNFTMRKAFSEVVAETAASDSEFPPLQAIKQPLPLIIKKGMKHNVSETQETKRSEDISSSKETLNGDPFLRIGSNVVPVHISGGGKIKQNVSLKHATVYVGFEHECPRGHRFLLTTDHLDELGSFFSLPEDSHNTIIVNKARSAHTSKLVENSAIQLDESTLSDSLKDVGARLQSVSFDDGGRAFSLLNRNLPIYLKCPQCRVSKTKKDSPNIKFAGTISQLQRIFMVTPPFPVVVATNPVIQFEASCLPPSAQDRDQKLKFDLGCRVILPPDSFLTLRLPFVYGVQLDDRCQVPLGPFEHQPELTAWIMKGTTLQLISLGKSNLEE